MTIFTEYYCQSHVAPLITSRAQHGMQTFNLGKIYVLVLSQLEQETGGLYTEFGIVINLISIERRQRVGSIGLRHNLQLKYIKFISRVTRSPTLSSLYFTHFTFLGLLSVTLLFGILSVQY